jgi:hypothetical protein
VSRDHQSAVLCVVYPESLDAHGLQPIGSRALKAGDTAPPFAPNDPNGNAVTSSALLAEGLGFLLANVPPLITQPESRA